MFEIFFGIALIVFASKVGPAVARRVGQGNDPGLARRLQDMEDRVTTNEERLLGLSAGTHERLLDIEERLDFAERVVQSQRHKKQLPGASQDE